MVDDTAVVESEASLLERTEENIDSSILDEKDETKGP